MRTLALMRVFVGLLTAAPMMAGAVSASHLPASLNLSSLLNYTVNVVTVGNGVECQLTLKLRGNVSGATEFEILSKWAGRDDFYPASKILN